MEASALFKPCAQAEETIRSKALARDAHKRRLGDILVGAGLISGEQRDKALAEKARAGHRHLGEILIKLGCVTEEVVAHGLAAQLEVRFVSLHEMTGSLPVLDLVDVRLASRHRCIPVYATTDRVGLAMANPFDLVAIEDIERVTNRRVEPLVATPSDIGAAIQRYYFHQSIF